MQVLNKALSNRARDGTAAVKGAVIHLYVHFETWCRIIQITETCIRTDEAGSDDLCNYDRYRSPVLDRTPSATLWGYLENVKSKTHQVA